MSSPAAEPIVVQADEEQKKPPRRPRPRQRKPRPVVMTGNEAAKPEASATPSLSERNPADLTNKEAPQAPNNQMKKKRNRKKKNAGIGPSVGAEAVATGPPNVKDIPDEDRNVPPAASSAPTRRQNAKKKNPHSRTVDKMNNRAVLQNYPPHLTLAECIERYNNNGRGQQQNLPPILRGKLRAMPGRDSMAFVACDRGSLVKDILIPDPWHRNRALDGDMVYVELLPSDDPTAAGLSESLATKLKMEEDEDKASKGSNNDEDDEDFKEEEGEFWQDDPVQMDIWNPQVRIPKPPPMMKATGLSSSSTVQRKGRVVYVIPPKSGRESEMHPTPEGEDHQVVPRKRLVGFLQRLNSGQILLNCTNRSLPQFCCPHSAGNLVPKVADMKSTMILAEYHYGSWREEQVQWPPCCNLKVLGQSCLLEDELVALLTEFGVDHGDHPAAVLRDVDAAVKSGIVQDESTGEWGWRPTRDMYEGRRDYRNQRIFTIDPTTAKDLDDALHIQELPDGSIELGVHIADVSFFVRPGQDVDEEAQRRSTTVYLVDRTIPMLPRPLCEVACSLNENVERLAFSCVWRMNRDGTLRLKENSTQEDVWYGRTVIRSCARLDYSTAQNIIEDKVAVKGNEDGTMDDTLWPPSRRPTGCHTIAQVAADVRLMNQVAIARRRLRFENGALALHSVKLTFDVDPVDGPLLASPYPIRDSNRLVEEYMLLANYLVAQRLITHAGDRACLRRHPPPLMDSMEKVSNLTKASLNYELSLETSEGLQRSLRHIGTICHDPLVLQCITQMMTVPMQQAIYFAAGTLNPSDWRHYALNSKLLSWM
jgi:DIS3-like exonuclease 2